MARSSKSKIGVAIFLVIEFLVFALVVIGTPIAQFKPKNTAGYIYGSWSFTGSGSGSTGYDCPVLYNKDMETCQANYCLTTNTCYSSKEDCVAAAQAKFTNCQNGNGYQITQASGYKSKSCLTVWGAKSNCGSTKYAAKGIAAFGCGQRKNNMTGAMVFAIVSIISSFLCLLYALMVFMGCCQTFLLGIILAIFTFATLLVCWACVAGVYNNTMCNCVTCFMGGKLKNGWKYGPGFFLFIISWGLQTINVVLGLFIFLC